MFWYFEQKTRTGAPFGSNFTPLQFTLKPAAISQSRGLPVLVHGIRGTMHPNAHVGGFSTPSTAATEARAGEPTFQCHYEDCLRIFRRKTSLTNHLKAHKNINSRSINRSKRARRRSELLRQAAEASASIARTHQSQMTTAALTTAASASTSTSGQTFLDQSPTPLTFNYQLGYNDTREAEAQTSPNEISLPRGFQIGPEYLAAQQQPAAPNIALPWVEIDGVQSDPLAYSTNTIPNCGQVESSCVDVNWWNDDFLNPFGPLHEEGEPLFLTNEYGYELSTEGEPVFPQPISFPKQEDEVNPVHSEGHNMVIRTTGYGGNL